MSRITPELERAILGEGANDRVMIDARLQRTAWSVGWALMGGGRPITEEKSGSARWWPACPSPLPRGRPITEEKSGSARDRKLRCRLCGNRLRLGDEPIERQYDHVLRHVCDLGAERLTIFLALRILQSSKAAVFSAFGFYPGTIAARSFWSRIREDRRKGI